MRIVLLCATRRGCLFLEKLTNLLPLKKLVVFSFREEPWEPMFLDDLRAMTLMKGGDFFETRRGQGQEWEKFWESAAVDLMFVVSWRYKIPPSVFRQPPLGTFVFHDSLLPKYRGFSPTVWAIINGDDHAGVTLFEITEEIDWGDIVDQESVMIGPDDTIADAMEHVTQTYLVLLERNLRSLINRTAPRYPQDHSLATYCCKRTPEDNFIDWSQPSIRIFNLIRAITKPYPGALTFLGRKLLRIWAAKRLDSYHHYTGRIAGKVVEVIPDCGAVVLTGDGALMLTQVQCEGSINTSASNLLRVGQTLGK